MRTRSTIRCRSRNSKNSRRNSPWRVYLSEEALKDGGGRLATRHRRREIGLFQAASGAVRVDTGRSLARLSDVPLALGTRCRFAQSVRRRCGFDFYGKVLGGQSEQLAREKRGVRFIGGLMGEGWGELYVARYSRPKPRRRREDLVANLLNVYRQRIETADWMSPETRKKALEKLAHFTVKIGYPDKWLGLFQVRGQGRRSYRQSVAGAACSEWNRRLARLDGAVDRGEWGRSPQTVNAYYDTSLNEIVFPAAILQRPSRIPMPTDAVNYGGIGAVIGHEISQASMIRGQQIRRKRVLCRTGGSLMTRKNFDARTAALVKQVRHL